jgi:hypothetical protein
MFPLESYLLRRNEVSKLFSNSKQLKNLADVLTKYIRLPFSLDSIPGAVLEATLAHVRESEVLNTYDFVDVIKRDIKVGWQVKSTKSTTPVTWKRAKIPNQVTLVKASYQSVKDAQTLGDAIIEFCNAHARASIRNFDLDKIGYSRLVVFPNGKVLYFERLLCTRKAPNIFDPLDFEWHWSSPKKTVKKEQLTALHGYHRETNTKWFAWHGLGENQLHFSGEVNWWPSKGNSHAISFVLPSLEQKLKLEEFIDLLADTDIPD